MFFGLQGALDQVDLPLFPINNGNRHWCLGVLKLCFYYNLMVSYYLSFLICFLGVSVILCSYSRTPVTRTLKGNEKLFELARFRVIGVH